jgi:hypothetical protein
VDGLTSFELLDVFVTFVHELGGNLCQLLTPNCVHTNFFSIISYTVEPEATVGGRVPNTSNKC